MKPPALGELTRGRARIVFSSCTHSRAFLLVPEWCHDMVLLLQHRNGHCPGNPVRATFLMASPAAACLVVFRTSKSREPDQNIRSGPRRLGVSRHSILGRLRLSNRNGSVCCLQFAAMS